MFWIRLHRTLNYNQIKFSATSMVLSKHMVEIIKDICTCNKTMENTIFSFRRNGMCGWCSKDR